MPLTAAEGKLALGDFQEAINSSDQGIAGRSDESAEANCFNAHSFWALGQFAASPEESQRRLNLVLVFVLRIARRFFQLDHAGLAKTRHE